MPSRTPARYLAPAALVAAAVAVYVVGFGGGSGSSSDSSSSTPKTSSQKGRSSTGTTGSPATTTAPAATAKTYTVQSGDVLGAIAEKNGLTVEQLQQLNPDVDAQSLRVGQTLKLSQ